MASVFSNSESIQFTAILGDLLHKQDVYVTKQNFGPEIDRFFSNHHQANYLRAFRPDLIPPPASPNQPPNDHTLGTVFEFHYYSDLNFRFTYIQRLRQSPDFFGYIHRTLNISAPVAPNPAQ